MRLGLGLSITGQSRLGVAGFSPKEIFEGGEIGVWYDPSDLTTLYQDAAGTTPVTADGDPVGLILDKSQELAQGSNAVANGDFSGGLTSWSNPSGHWTVASGQAYHAASASYNELSQTISTTVGRIEFDINVITATGTVQFFYVNAVGTAKGISLSTGVSSVSYFAYDGIQKIGFARAGGTPGEFYVDNVSVTEIAGHHASQETDSKRPLYKTAGVLHWLEFDGVNDALATSTLTPTANKMQFFTGLKRSGDGGGTAVVAELSANAASNVNTFVVYAPVTSGSIKRSYGLFPRGSSAAITLMDDNSFPVPTTNVVTGLADISGDMARLRVDGTQVKENLADQGSGAAYRSDKIYMGGREGTSLYFNGNLYGLTIRFGPNLDAPTIAEVEGYMAAKADIAI